MKYLGFIIFLAGVIFGLWWVALIGLFMYELGGVTLIAASTLSFGNNGSHNDHGP